jgi:capsular polysaccharide transport system permease protein
LAEALLQRERPEEAVECAYRAFGAVQDDAALLRICAWVFSNCGCHEPAAAAYRRLVDLCPDWTEGYRHASGSLAQAGQREDAAAYALEACERDPLNAEFALHAASVLAEQRCNDRAAELARRAIGLAPDNADVVTSGAELLMRCEQADAAAKILTEAAFATSDPRLLRVLSAAEMLCGRLDAALEAVDRAIAGNPGQAEYHVHRGHLLSRIGDLAEAEAAFDRAGELDPDGPDPKRARMSLYLAAGLATEATAAGGELLHRFPDDRPAAEAVLHLLNHRLDTIDGQYVVLGDKNRRSAAAERRPTGFVDRLRSQRRVIRALIIRETRTRYADTRLGYGWALVEPVLHIALLSVTFAVLTHGRPPIGTHFFIFYYTGLIPYHRFVHSSSAMCHSVTGNAPLLQLPPVTTFDVIAARGLLEVMTDVVVALLLLAGFLAIGLDALPDDLLGPLLALLVTAAFGCGIGFVNAVVTVFWRSWEKAYGQCVRVLYFISGIFYVPGMMPDWARDLLAWNPLLHAIDWFRAGFFAGYRPHWLAPFYLISVAVAAMLAGFALHRVMRRKLTVPL